MPGLKTLYLNCNVPGQLERRVLGSERTGQNGRVWSNCEEFPFEACTKKVYSDILDDEDDPAEAEKEGNEMEDEELDPLDAYMEEVKEEVKKFNMRSVKGGGGNEKVWNSIFKDLYSQLDKLVSMLH